MRLLSDQYAKRDALNALLPIGPLFPLVIQTGRQYMAEVVGVTFTRRTKSFALDYEVQFYIASGSSVAAAATQVTMTGNGAVFSSTVTVLAMSLPAPFLP